MQGTDSATRSIEKDKLKSFQIFMLHLRLVDHLRKNSSNSNKRLLLHKPDLNFHLAIDHANSAVYGKQVNKIRE